MYPNSIAFFQKAWRGHNHLKRAQREGEGEQLLKRLGEGWVVAVENEHRGEVITVNT